MGNNQSRKTPLQDTPAYDMFMQYGPQSCKLLAKWHKDALFPKEGSFDMDQIYFLRAGLLSLKSQSRRGQWRAFSCWLEEASKRQSESQAQSFKEAQEKLDAQLADKVAQSKLAQEKLEAQLAESQLTQEKLEAQLAESQLAQETLEAQLTESELTQEKLEAQLAESQLAQETLEAQLAESQLTQEKLEAQLAESERAQEKLEAQLAESEDTQEKLEAQLAESELAQETLEAQLTEKEREAEVADLKAKCEAASETSGPVARCPWMPKPSPQVLPAPWHLFLEGGNGPAAALATWAPAEVLGLGSHFPNIQERPGEFKEALDFIFRRYNPRWGEVNLFLGIVIPQRTVREQLLANARWPAKDPGAEVALMLARQCLLGAVLGVRPKHIDWVRLRQCRQKDGETPPVFWKRLEKWFEKYSGVPQPAANAPDVMAYAFVQSLRPETLEWLKRMGRDWRMTSLSELVDVADFSEYLETQERKRWERGFDNAAYRMFCDSD